VARVKGDGPKALGIVDQLMTGGMVGSFSNVIDPRFGQSLQSRDAAQKQANIQFLKDAGINAAGAAVGYGIGKGVVRVAKSGQIQRLGNTFRGEQIIVHGTPADLSGQTHLLPRAGSSAAPTDPVVFGANPLPKYRGSIPEQAAAFAGESPGGPRVGAQHNVVVGRVSKSAIDRRGSSQPRWLESSQPVKIEGIVKSTDPLYEKKLRQMLRSQGAPIDASLARRVRDAAAARKAARIDRGSGV